MPRNVQSTLAKLAALLLALTTVAIPGIANAATLSSASLSLSDSRPLSGSVGTGVNYAFHTSGVTTGAPGHIECIKETFATTATGSTVPTGMDTTVSAVALNNSATTYVPTPASWTLDKSVNGTLKLTYATGEIPSSAGPDVLSVDGITNSSIANTTYFMHFNTYNNTDCTSSPVDTTTVEFILTNGSLMSLTIDNTLSFSVAGHAASTCMTGVTATVDNSSSPNTIPFGTVTSNAIACQVLTAATNATNGYTIYVRDNGQLQNTLGQKIPDVGSTTGSYTNGYSNATPGATFTNNTSSLATYPGFNQGAYGYTTDDSSLGTGTANRFTNGGQHWASYGHSTDGTGNAEIAYEPVGVSSTTYNIAHQVGITNLTQPGNYQTTVIYTCTPVY
ncbi:MAG TPA: hypothetical protein VGH44_03800 [Candidatus Saccharimonadia bacterium]